MKYNRTDYIKFLETEYNNQMDSFGRLINTKAQTLKERGEIFVALFLKVDDNGRAIFKVRVSDNMPRKNSFWTASILGEGMDKFKNWGELSWADLREKYQIDYSDVSCVWIGKSDKPDFCLVGIKDLGVEFVKKLEESSPAVAFGPQDPPLKYILNLIGIVKDTSNRLVSNILDLEFATTNDWNPTLIDYKQDLNTLIRDKFKTNNCLVIQGPPGTGKTYRMAKLASSLLNENASVLVTALTNQALKEVALKDDLKDFLKSGKVSKSSLTIDDIKEVKGLLPIVENECNATAGHLSLATFYVASEWAKSLENIPFDYVIMDEASQAYLPMIAATMKLGKQIIWVGDQEQLSPIVTMSDELISGNNWWPMVSGFKTLCENLSFPSFMLSDTFRLTNRGADFTGAFYDGKLRSVSDHQTEPLDLPYLNKEGGPVLIDLELPLGDKKPNVAISKIWECTYSILSKNPKARVAILSKFKASVKEIQKQFVLNLNKKELPENIIIETVDRVQGLTVDYCIFFIPNASIQYSLTTDLFNVATSRAVYSTIIIADKHLIGQYMPSDIRKFLLKLYPDDFVEIKNEDKKTISTNDIAVKVVSKIDLSQFERKRWEIKEGIENVYIIDTNVFVKCPDIISKIGRAYTIVIPSTVLEELDKLKLKKSVDQSRLLKAAKNINTAFSNRFSKMEEPDVSLLPNGFDMNNPDCKILSVALKYNKNGANAILLTSDNMLQSRASALGLTTLSLSQFLH